MRSDNGGEISTNDLIPKASGQCVLLPGFRAHGHLYTIRDFERMGRSAVEIRFPKMPPGAVVVFKTWVDKDSIIENRIFQNPAPIDANVPNLEQLCDNMDDVATNLALFRVRTEEMATTGNSMNVYNY